MAVDKSIHAPPWEVSTDKQRLDRELIHHFLSTSYWANGISRELVDRAIDHSFCFGLYESGQQLAFGRVITDFSTFGWLADVFVEESRRSEGIGKFLIHSIVNHEELKPMRRLMLATLDAHKLYEQHGFSGLSHPERFMEKRILNAYGQPTSN